MNSIAITDLKKKFKNKIALKNISLNFSKKNITGLLGPNGSGKTTLFNIITGFLDADEGRIKIDELDITSYSLDRRSKLGLTYLPQEASIFRDLSVYDNILSVAELFYSKKEKF